MKATKLATLRRLHLYVAVFFAPAIIFFAFSGVLQTYGFHEALDGGGKPPAWIAAIASLHQHQRLHRSAKARPVDAHEGDRPAARPGAAADGAPRQQPVGTAALKLFTALMGLGLVVASLLGIVVALGTRATRRVSVVTLAIGFVLPVVLILI